MNLRRMCMQEVYKQFGLGEMTIDFIGHAIALHRDDAYMSQPAMDTVLKVKLYYNSLTRFEGTASPYIYPLYGLGELPQVLTPSSSRQTPMSLLFHRRCLLMGGLEQIIHAISLSKSLGQHAYSILACTHTSGALQDD